ncbi:MAG TPA: thioredoxin family protein [Bacteroidales bacterium]|nr:thioredoxin family protein [Bacteroidales bacterium]HOX76606.1 thioredoxin family protein [Bacteroidales bacterium]HPM92507.1 thioredoxin family protein [Bacteroidales bacterium]
MAIQIVILCPGSKCKKCRRMIRQVEEAVLESGLEAEVKILDTLDDLMKYNTYVLPALVINGKMLARGYVPEKSMIIKEMNKLPDNGKKYES